jgi:hypothetical protein
MPTRQEPTLMLGLAVYTHCLEQHKSKLGEAADKSQSLLIKSSMQYLQENVVIHQFICFALVTGLCTFRILENVNSDNFTSSFLNPCTSMKKYN